MNGLIYCYPTTAGRTAGTPNMTILAVSRDKGSKQEKVARATKPYKVSVGSSHCRLSSHSRVQETNAAHTI